MPLKILRAGARVLALSAWVLAPVLAQQPPAQRDTTAAVDTAAPPGAAIVVRGETLAVLTERLGPFTASERAAAIAERLRRFAGAGDSIMVVPGEGSDELLVGDNVLMTVTEADARAAGVPRAELSSRIAGRLQRGLRASSVLAVVKIVALGVLWTALATGALALVLIAMGRLFPRIYATLEGWRETRMPAIRLQRLELLTSSRATDLAIGSARLVRLSLVVVLVYFYVPLVLRFFPWTRDLSQEILGYVVEPLARMWVAFVTYLPNVFFIAVIVLVTRYVLKLIHLVFLAIGRGTVTIANFDRDWAEPTYKIVRVLVLAFAVVVLFPYLPGSDSDAFKGVSLFLGVLLSLGSSSAIANVVAGVVLTYTRAFRIGDRVQVGDTTGDVVAKTLLVTRVRTIKNVDVTIPNAMVLGSHIVNYSAMAKREGLVLHTGVTIGYDAPWRKVHELLIAAARATPGILAEPAPFVLQTSLDDFYVSYQINAYTDKPEAMARTYSTLHANIQDKFNEAGVEIMSPHYEARREGPITIPASYLPGKSPAPPGAGQTGEGRA